MFLLSKAEKVWGNIQYEMKKIKACGIKENQFCW